jgi:hypothetical protein
MFATAQTTGSSNDDQARALEALRKAEAEPAVPDRISPAAAAAAAPAPAAEPVPATEPAAAATPTPTNEPAPATEPVPATEPAAVVAPAPATNSLHIVAPEPAITSATPGTTNEQNKALEIPRHTGPMTLRDREAQWTQAQRMRKMAEEKALTDRVTQEEAARRQQEQDALKIKQATEQARTDQMAQEEFARRQQTQDALRIKEAMEMERVAAEQVRIARVQEEAVRKKAQEEAARRAEQLKKNMQVHPAEVEISNTPLTEKEKKLADLLRRYQADEITPYDYHMQRAKIVAEP